MPELKVLKIVNSLKTPENSINPHKVFKTKLRIKI